jgi:hypothetical protein
MAPVLGTGYREFESLHHDHLLSCSSMVERSAVNGMVVGSSPTTTGFLKCKYICGTVKKHTWTADNNMF